MYMKLKDGKSKVLTLSYDDGAVQDGRLIDIMNRSGLKGTFNLNTGWYAPEDAADNPRRYDRMKLTEAKALYIHSGHEIAVHGVTHPPLDRIRTTDVLFEILEDRKNIEREYGVIARGMAYPFGAYDERVMDCLKMCGICYARTCEATENFEFPKNWLALRPTCHHDNPGLMELARQFAEADDRSPWACRMFYLWGHSYEFDHNDNWNVIEAFAEYIGGRDDIWYATNIEIYDYVQSYERLQTSADESMVFNPSATDVWFCKDDAMYCVHGGETLML